PDWQSAAKLVRTIAENYKLPYYTLSPTYSVCKNHGYIQGEQFTCPHCGEKAEVYSRITGYYRPVANWNDGKSQEYKDRLVYNIANSKLTRNGRADEAQDNVTELASAQLTDGLYLFATQTCPNCKAMATLLDKAGIGFEKIFVEDNQELAKSLGLRQAPTLVEVKGNEVTKYENVVPIKTFIQNRIKGIC
ncbi:MAG: ribonucleoside triphosphate reductase, partial [Clostridia bacterium]|nr:ribonucleoside triphosphate reductase [Clostridia bacterium]